MPKKLKATNCGVWLNHSCRNISLHSEAAVHAYLTEQLWPELSLSSRQGYRGKTCHRRWAGTVVRPSGVDFGIGKRAGVWENLHHIILQNMHYMNKDRLDHSPYWRLCHPGKKRSQLTGSNPVDRGHPGSKHRIVTDWNGIPFVVGLTAAVVRDCKMLEYTLDHLPSLRNLHGKPACYPQKLHTDKGYDSPFCRQACMVRHIKHWITKWGVESSTHLEKHRWVIERTFAWLHWYKRLHVRYERRGDIHLALPTLAVALIAFWFC